MAKRVLGDAEASGAKRLRVDLDELEARVILLARHKQIEALEHEVSTYVILDTPEMRAAEAALTAAKAKKKTTWAAVDKAWQQDVHKSWPFFLGPGFALRCERTPQPADPTISRTDAAILAMVHSPNPPPWSTREEQEELDRLDDAAETARQEYNALREVLAPKRRHAENLQELAHLRKHVADQPRPDAASLRKAVDDARGCLDHLERLL